MCVAVKSGISGIKELLAEKEIYQFLEHFSEFLEFSKVKMHFLQKMLKNWSSFRKKYFIFFRF